MKYIDADRLKELLSNKYKEFTEKSKNFCFMQYQFMADGLTIAEQTVDSLQQEQPEVDLEKEIDDELDRNWRGHYIEHRRFVESAKYFYKLGLNAKK